MHHPKHIYFTGITTGILCGSLSALTVWQSMKYISDHLEMAQNPVVRIMVLSTLVGAGLGLLIAFLVHQISKPKRR